MKLKRILSHSDRTSVNVDRVVHTLVTMFAEEQGISIQEATFRLIGRGLAAEWGIPWNSPDDEGHSSRSL